MNTEIYQTASVRFYQFTRNLLDREHARSEGEVHCALVCTHNLGGVKQPRRYQKKRARGEKQVLTILKLYSSLERTFLFFFKDTIPLLYIPRIHLNYFLSHKIPQENSVFPSTENLSSK